MAHIKAVDLLPLESLASRLLGIGLMKSAMMTTSDDQMTYNTTLLEGPKERY